MSDPRAEDARERRRLSAEVGERMDAIEQAAFFEAAERWPYGERLPIKRELPGGLGFDCAVLRRGDGPVVWLNEGGHVQYETFEDIARAGWRTD